MPFTAKQRALFHAAAARHEPGMQKLAGEAESFKAKGLERPPVKKKKPDVEEEPYEAWNSLRGTK